MKKRYIVHYATNDPFSQYVQVARLTTAQRERLEKRFERMEKEGTIHSHAIGLLDTEEFSYQHLVEELSGTVTTRRDARHLSRRAPLTIRV